jgi:O-antigen/teichoic acid export membrane protein
VNAIARTRLIWTGSALRAGLFRSGMVAVAMRMFGLAAGLIISVVLARALEPSGYGIDTFAFSLISLLAVPIQLGIPTLGLREVALSVEHRDAGRLRGFLRWSHRTILLTSAVIGIVTIAVVWAIRERLEPNLPQTVLAAVALLAITSFSRLREAALQGLKQFARAQIPEQIVLPLLFLAGMAFVWLASPGLQHHFSVLPQHAMLAYTACSIVAFMLGSAFLSRSLPADVARAIPRTDAKRWAKSLLPMALTSGFVVISGHCSILVLGVFSTSEEAGLFRVASSTAALAVFVCATVGGIASPHIAALYNRGDVQKLQSLAVHSAWASVIPALVVLAVLAGFGAELLRVVFGPQFEAAYAALVILTVGQAINGATGVVHCLLNMTGNERDTLRGVVLGGLTNLVLALVLVPSMGLMGAAIAASAAIAVENVWLCALVRSRLGISSSVFGKAAT